MLRPSTLLVVGVISHLWCAARLVGIAHHSFYSVHLLFHILINGFSVIYVGIAVIYLSVFRLLLFFL